MSVVQLGEVLNYCSMSECTNVIQRKYLTLCPHVTPLIEQYVKLQSVLFAESLILKG